jgi:hypothetical protein
MTIRHELRGWCRFLWIGLIAVGILAGSWRPTTWFNYYLRVFVLGFLFISVIGLFGYGFVCPRCRGSLAIKTGRYLVGADVRAQSAASALRSHWTLLLTQSERANDFMQRPGKFSERSAFVVH